MRDDFEVSDSIMEQFFAYASKRYGTKFKPTAAEEAKPSPKLRAVTTENAHEFTPTPKRRGRPPNVSEGGNVVALRPTEPKALPPAPDDPDLRFRVRARAAGMALKAFQKGEESDFDACLVKAWALLGYSPP
ncbi:MAG TPA: hypothetical protein VN280_00450 [Variovorax sp.]|nr:hypothetical protein [Variovorax sp.]